MKTTKPRAGESTVIWSDRKSLRTVYTCVWDRTGMIAVIGPRDTIRTTQREYNRLVKVWRKEGLTPS